MRVREYLVLFALAAGRCIFRQPQLLLLCLLWPWEEQRSRTSASTGSSTTWGQHVPWSSPTCFLVWQ